MSTKPMPLNLLYKTIAQYASMSEAAELKALEVATHIEFANVALKGRVAPRETQELLDRLQSSLRLQNDLLARLREQLKTFQEQLHARKDEELKSFGV